MKSGDKYGMLVLIKKVPKPDNKNRKGQYWLCKCDCGNECVKHYHDLWSGDTKSCGCLKHRKPIYDKNKVEISNHAGIYGFQNIYNGKWYIGKTKNLYNRYKDHYNDWKNNQNKQFYQAIKKYGWDSFNYYILKEYNEIPDAKELSRQEEYFIKEKDSYKNGYNAAENSSGGFYSDEHRQKCIDALKNLNNSQKNENHPRTDFSKQDIMQIFSYAMKGAPVKWVYEQYKTHHITYESFKQIYRGEHFTEYLPDNWDSRPVVATNATLWGSWVVDIKTRILKGEPLELIWKDYQDKCSLNQLKDIKNNRTYKQIRPCID